MKAFARPAVFGGFDGLTAVLGVLLTLSGHGSLAFWAALSLGAAECVGMTAGEWLSDSDHGFIAALVIGVATMAGSVLPAVPYLFLAGVPAMAASVGVLALLGVGITWMRSTDRGWWRALMETYGVIAVAFAAVAVIQYVTPGGAR